MGEEPLTRGHDLADSEEPDPAPTDFMDRMRGWQEMFLDNQAMDEEKGAERSGSSDSEYFDPVSDLNHYRLVNEVWHFSSVDWGEKCWSPPCHAHDLSC